MTGDEGVIIITITGPRCDISSALPEIFQVCEGYELKMDVSRAAHDKHNYSGLFS